MVTRMFRPTREAFGILTSTEVITGKRAIKTLTYASKLFSARVALALGVNIGIV